jgi:hypothetical protein
MNRTINLAHDKAAFQVFFEVYKRLNGGARSLRPLLDFR